MNDILIENIKLKAELEYDILFESKEFRSLDSGTKSFLKECYDMGVNTGIYFHQNEQMLLESMDEGFFDRVKAGAVRAGQGIKNLSGFGTQTADSKDAGVESLLKGFKQKFEKAKQSPGGGPNPGAEALKKKIVDDIDYIDDKTKTDPNPAPDQKTAEDIVIKTPNVPKSLKDKIIQGIRENPGKIKFLLAALSFGAGVAAATYSLNPVVGQAAGAAINGIGNAALAKIQGRRTSDAVMSGLTQGVAGGALAGLGGAAVNAISTAIDNAGEVSPNAFQVKKTKAAVPAPPAPRTPDDIEPISPEPNRWDEVPKGNTMPPEQPAVTGQDNPTAPATPAASWKPTGDTRADRVAFDADRQSQYYKSRGYTGPKDTLGRPKALFRENKESMFVKSYNNTYVLKKSLNENLEEKWNEGVEETLDEALNAEQQKAYNEFLADLGKMFKKKPEDVVAFMQSQGDRFKNVLDYLNQNVTPTAAPQQAAPDQQPQGQPQDQGQVKPSLVKHINGIKSSPLFASDLAARIQSLVDAKATGVVGDKAPMLQLRVFLKTLNNILNTNSANFRKQIGDPSALLQQVNEDIKQYSDLAKQISAVMPSIIGATFELRQMFGVRKPQAPGGAAPAGAVPPQIKEVENKSNLSTEELSRAKFFLSKLVDLGTMAKSIDVAKGDTVQLKNLYKELLQLANLIVNKNVKGIKLNKKIDVAFQGKDILGDLPVDKKTSPVKKGPGDMFKEGKKNNFKLR